MHEECCYISKELGREGVECEGLQQGVPPTQVPSYYKSHVYPCKEHEAGDVDYIIIIINIVTSSDPTSKYVVVVDY